MDSTNGGYNLIPFLFWISVGIILYTYFGYPLLLAVFARLFPVKSRAPQKSSLSVTLLIAAYNEELVIEEKIRNSLAIDYPHDQLQILVITDGSSDSTPTLVQKFAKDGVALLHESKRRGKMAAINRAIPSARGDIVVFSDANNYYRADAIRNLVAPFGDPGIGAVSGAKMIDDPDGNLGASEGLYWKYESFIKRQESLLGSCTSASGEILAIRRDAYRRPPDNVINDDFYIAMQVIRQGFRLVYAPEAISYERISPSAKDEIIRRTRINAGRYQAIAMAGQIVPLNRPVLVWQIVSHKFLRPFVPFFMMGAAIFNVLAVLFPPKTGTLPSLSMPFSIILLAVQVAFYASAWIGSRFSEHGKQGGLVKLLYLPTFLINSNLASLQGLVKFLRGGEFHIWERIQRG